MPQFAIVRRPYLEQARTFIETYVLPRMDAFLGKLASGARTDCYRGLAELTRGLLAMEGAFLGCNNGSGAETSGRA